MISGGNATGYVSDMDAGVRFYSEKLGLSLTNRALLWEAAMARAAASRWRIGCQHGVPHSFG